MKGSLLAAAAFATWAAGTAAQTPASVASASFASSEQLQALIAKAEREIRPDQATFGQQLLVGTPPYTAVLEYRRAVTTAVTHFQAAELMIAIEGSGTLVTGGALVAPKIRDSANTTGTAIEGGNAQRFQKGDTMMIPPGVPHWFSAIDGRLALIAVKIPAAQAAHGSDGGPAAGGNDQPGMPNRHAGASPGPSATATTDGL